MQKRTKYIIYTIIIVMLFGTGVIAGCNGSGGATGRMESENKELQGRIISYSATIESLKSDRGRIDQRNRDLEQQVNELGEVISELTEISGGIGNGLQSVSGEISRSRRGIQEVGEGLGELDKEIRQAIERAENP